MIISKILFLLIIGFMACTPCVCAEEPEFSEYEIKAGFIYNFAKFVEWPPEVSRDENKPLALCISGANPFGNSIAAINNKTVQNRRLETRALGRSRDFKGCNIVFISSSEKEILPQLLEVLRNSPVLTIGDARDFAQNGVMINLVMDGNKVRFDINAESARRARISISSKLLKLARTIYR